MVIPPPASTTSPFSRVGTSSASWGAKAEPGPPARSSDWSRTRSSPSAIGATTASAVRDWSLMPAASSVAGGCQVPTVRVPPGFTAGGFGACGNSVQEVARIAIASSPGECRVGDGRSR